MNKKKHMPMSSFSLLQDGGGVPSSKAKSLLIHHHLETFSPSRLPPHQILSPSLNINSSPSKKQFSCYNPIKTSFLAVVIAPVPFLF